jgi:hypothetical protein
MGYTLFHKEEYKQLGKLLEYISKSPCEDTWLQGQRTHEDRTSAIMMGYQLLVDVEGRYESTLVTRTIEFS